MRPAALRPAAAVITPLLLGLTASLLPACSSAPTAPSAPSAPTPTRAGEVYRAAGRISLSTEAGPLEPAQSFMAQFQIAGSAEAGQMQILAPTGSVVAQLFWQPGLALLQQGESKQVYDSPEAMMQAAVGSSLPMPLLFALLQGQAPQQSDWRFQLDQYHRGLIQADRLQPLPRVKVRIKLDDTP